MTHLFDETLVHILKNEFQYEVFDSVCKFVFNPSHLIMLILSDKYAMYNYKL